MAFRTVIMELDVEWFVVVDEALFVVSSAR
jgi:hypothetical protein